MAVQSEILCNLGGLLRSVLRRGGHGRRGSECDPSAQEIFRRKYKRFQELLESNAELLKIVSDMETKLRGERIFGMAYVEAQATRAVFHALRMVASYEGLCGEAQPRVRERVESLRDEIKGELESRKKPVVTARVLPYARINREMVDAVGGKSANLGEIMNHVGLPVPRGFAITTAAFNEFLDHDGLRGEIRRLARGVSAESPESIETAGEEIQRTILQSPPPPELERDILEAHAALAHACGLAPEDLRVALRSSAVGEDGDCSFAGQYLSMLNVERGRLIASYRYVLASLYTPRAISYRLLKGLSDGDLSMSVACLEMIDSAASGVMYSRHPYDAADERVRIDAVWGLGPYAVDGVVTPDSLSVTRAGLEIQDERVADKSVMLTCGPAGSLRELPVPPELRGAPCLTPERARELAGWALRLEAHYGRAQDVEWALTPDGRLLVLQSRPLGLAGETKLAPPGLPPVQDLVPLVAGGETAQPGVGAGPAFVVTSEDADLSGFPAGGVLVASHSSPRFMVLMHEAQAIVTDFGSITGHMASLSREFDVPTLLGCKTATRDIPAGAIVTVDAYSGRVLAGTVPELLAFKAPRASHMRGTPVHDALCRVAERIAPLHLTDPRSPDFRAAGCRSLHDVARLLHERCYAVMFKLGDMAAGSSGVAMRLRAQTGLDLHVIDLGGGVAPAPEGVRRRDLAPEDIIAAPFRALIDGLTLDRAQLTTPRPVQMRGLLSVVGRQMMTNPEAEGQRFGDKSYAIISDKYVNFSSRVGYHYGVLDCYCGRTVSKNYVSFSFKGGAADDVKRARRARAIGLILEGHGFKVEVRGDAVAGRLQKHETAVILEKLWVMGKLLQFTRQTDMLMVDEKSVRDMAECFLSGRYVLGGSCPIGPTDGSTGGASTTEDPSAESPGAADAARVRSDAPDVKDQD